MKKDIKLVAIDLDGTLLDDKKIVPIENVEIIKRLRNDGINIAIATGRPAQGFSWIRKEAGLMKDHEYSITNTGTTIIRNKDDKIIISNTLIMEDFLEVEKLGEGFDLQIGFYNGDYLYNNHDFPNKVYQIESKILKMDIKKFDPRSFNGSIERICVTGAPDELDKFQEKFESSLNEKYTTVRSTIGMFEVTNKKASKGKALKLLADYLGVDMSQTLAIGDAENDRTMLDMAAVSATTANGDEAIKEIVDIVSEKTNNQAGVCQILESYFYK